MNGVTRWAVLVGVLVLAGLFVWLPRNDGDEPAGETAAVSEELRAARAKASLRPCPSPQKDWRYDRYAGVTGTCVADGSRVDLGNLLTDGTILVNVWATWCQPCREELPLLQKYADRQAEPSDGAPEDAVQVVTVQVESSQLDGLALLSELGVTLPVVHDGDDARGPIRDALKVPTALPASYLVLPKVGVTFVSNPRVFTSIEEIDEAVRKARAAHL